MPRDDDRVAVENRLTGLETRVATLEERRRERRQVLKEVEEDLEGELEEMDRKLCWTRRMVAATLAAVGGDVGWDAISGGVPDPAAELGMQLLQAVGLG